MDAIKFLIERNRMCKENSACNQCIFYRSEVEPANTNCMKFSEEYPGKLVEFVDKWAKKHQLKTRQTEFLKVWPDTYLDERGVITIRPCVVSKKYQDDMDCGQTGCANCRREFWSQEVE